MRVKDLFLLFLILLFMLLSRLWRLDFPKVSYFDEGYQLAATQAMSEGNWLAAFQPNSVFALSSHLDWLHPPLFKYTLLPMLQVFGWQSWVWRFPSLVLAMASGMIFYFWLQILGKNFAFQQRSLEKREKLSTRMALLGTALFAVSGLFLVQSRIAMNDILALFWSLLSLYFFSSWCWPALHRQKRDEYLTALSLGFAFASKWTTAWLWLALASIALGMYGRSFLREKKWTRQITQGLFVWLLLPILIYGICFWPAFSHGLAFPAWVDLQKTIIQSQFTNPSQHAYASSLGQWLLNLRPVWYWTTSGLSSGETANIYALENPLLTIYQVLGLVLAVLLLFSRKLKGWFWRKLTPNRSFLEFLLFLFFALTLPYLGITRILFFYHSLLFLPIPLAILAYEAVLLTEDSSLARRRAILFNFLFWPFLVFVIFYPHWTALVIPESWANSTYFFLQSWK